MTFNYMGVEVTNIQNVIKNLTTQVNKAEEVTTCIYETVQYVRRIVNTRNQKHFKLLDKNKKGLSHHNWGKNLVNKTYY